MFDIIAENEDLVKQVNFCDDDVLNLCKSIMQDQNIIKCYDTFSAVNLYVTLKRKILELFEGIDL